MARLAIIVVIAASLLTGCGKEQIPEPQAPVEASGLQKQLQVADWLLGRVDADMEEQGKVSLALQQPLLEAGEAVKAMPASEAQSHVFEALRLTWHAARYSAGSSCEQDVFAQKLAWAKLHLKLAREELAKSYPVTAE